MELPPGTLLPRINGGRPRTNEYLFDGISALQPEPGQVAFFPILDSIAEFTIEANNVPAEFGRFNGGVVNVATRSGGNAVHGSVFEYFRNEALNARNYFANSGAFATTTARKPIYRRNLFGATLGAPILHDRLFFFGDYQGILQRIGVTRISTVPTVAERAGNFSGVAKIYNPNTTTTVNSRLTRTEFPERHHQHSAGPRGGCAARAFSAAYLRRRGQQLHARNERRRSPAAVRHTPGRCTRAARPRFCALHLLSRGGAARDTAAGRLRRHQRIGAGRGQCQRTDTHYRPADCAE